ncbi:branched-chain amino acid ABC transporter permease [Ramlibacter sp. G-1-2-2]|uniref:Branched-chain amino acid ABC transporter permease n=1 Tax=Ramlibacter agri TaxID=2728837 RepID=A0A848H8G0_9BURK|nr:branched-chain amino acid ABC transporter permease [Ramlibacter agri]NML47266.1 branched-chain amino acid ABC transporter permease [Ramlibacter agri]
MAELVFGGLAIGAVYALVAIGIVLSYRAAGVVNFAHGELMMVAAYAYVLAHDLGGGPAWQLAAALGAGALGGLLCWVLTGLVLRGAAEITLVIGTLGLLILLQSGARHLFTDTPMPAQAWLFADRDLALFGASVPANALLVVGITVVAAGLLMYWQRVTVFGQAVLAAAEDPWRAALSGIHVQSTLAISWLVSGVFAGLAGMLLGPVVGVFPTMGADIIFPAFIAAILGGFGSVAGALAGGLLLGLLQTFTVVEIGGAWKEVVMFAFLFLVLIWRPTGLVRLAAARKV